MLTIAYLGPEHTNAHLAAQRRFGRRAAYLHVPTVEDVFNAVERRKADYGVVPVENSLEGAVTHTLDRFIDFMDTPVAIHGEVEQVIHHYLILAKGVKPASLRLVFSHPQALAQCRGWLAKHLRHAALRETSSTADAVSHVLEDEAARGAIARKELALAYNLHALPIQEDRENKTRFVVIGLGQPPKGRRNKTSVLFGVKDRKSVV